MSCHTCERRSRANFYNRYVSQLGYGSITMLMSAAYFAGIRLSDRNTRAEWREDALYVSSTPNRVSVCVRAGAQNALLTYEGRHYQLKEPEHAGFIVQGRQPPEEPRNPQKDRS